VEEAAQVHRGHHLVVCARVVGERLADEDPGVVDQRVDPPEPVERLLDHVPSGLRLGDVTRNREEVALPGGLHRA
jgi:hypothetical protein